MIYLFVPFTAVDKIAYVLVFRRPGFESRLGLVFLSPPFIPPYFIN